VRRFGQALVLAHELPDDVRWLHAHFMHTPASVARYAALLRGLPFSMSAHARDIWTSPEWEKREKLAAAAFTVTCTRHNLEHLRALSTRDDDVSLVYHGLDLRRFGQAERTRGERDGRDPGHPVRLLSVGRAVEKKGYATLLRALARIPAGHAWTLDHVGGGPLLGRLRTLASTLGVEARIHWHGALSQEQVLEHYRRADLFVLASEVAGDGDRDGLPNVLMEAQSQSLAVVATRVSAVPEFIDEGLNGLLVEPGDVDALAGAVDRLIQDPARREQLGRCGNRRVRERFSMDEGIADLLARFGSAGEAAARAA
jgi:glycosyltransferase involved in cell wall biosynthesis